MSLDDIGLASICNELRKAKGRGGSLAGVSTIDIEIQHSRTITRYESGPIVPREAALLVSIILCFVAIFTAIKAVVNNND